MMSRLYVFVLLLIVSNIQAAQTEPTPTSAFPEPGSYTISEKFSDTLQRQYEITIPTGYPDAEQPVPLVIILHGAGGTGLGVKTLSEFDVLAEQETLITVYPDSIGDGWTDGRDPDAWNDDVAYLEHLIDTLIETLNIDPARVYVTGYSRGGMMAIRAGCLLPEKIAAVASVASTFPKYQVPACHESPSLPIMFILGTNDTVIQWDGRVGYYSAAESVEFWVLHNQCLADVLDVDETFDDDPDDEIMVRRATYNQCADDSEVTLYGAIGGGHTWPGHPANADLLGVTAMDIDANIVLWDFFSRHPKIQKITTEP